MQEGRRRVPTVLGGKSPLGHASCAGESITPVSQRRKSRPREGRGLTERGLGFQLRQLPDLPLTHHPQPRAARWALSLVLSTVPAQSWP